MITKKKRKYSNTRRQRLLEAFDAIQGIKDPKEAAKRIRALHKSYINLI